MPCDVIGQWGEAPDCMCTTAAASPGWRRSPNCRSRRSGGASKQLAHHTPPGWALAGVSLAEVRDVLGHSTVRMTEHCAHLAPENTRAALARLDVPAAGDLEGRRA